MTQVQAALEIFYQKFDIKTEADKEVIKPIFHFDQATIHTKRTNDALNAKAMNKKPGGQQPVMKDGWYLNDQNEKVTQQMFYMEGGQKVPKGLKMVLEERGHQFLDKVKVDVLRDLLSCYPDFEDDAKNTILVEYLTKNKAEIDYIPKYHCEFNPCENVWSYGKNEYRKNQDFRSMNHDRTIEKINAALDMVPISTIRKYFRTCRAFEDCYRQGFSEGITGPQVAKKMERIRKRKRAHRRAPVV